MVAVLETTPVWKLSEKAFTVKSRLASWASGAPAPTAASLSSSTVMENCLSVNPKPVIRIHLSPYFIRHFR